MTKEEANRINALLKNVTNIQILLNELLTPINELQQKYNTTIKETINIKLRAEDYLTKYGTFTLEATTKAIKNTVDKIIKNDKK